MSTPTLGPPRLLYVDNVLLVTWDPAAVPEGYTVQLTVTDGAGQPLTPPPLIRPVEGGAKVSGPAIAPGAVLVVSIQAVSPVESSGAVTLVQLAAPTNLRLGWAFDGVVAHWSAVDGAEAYRVVVGLDGEPPSLPQPAVRYGVNGDPTTAWIDGAGLRDGQVVTVVVLASAAGVMGPRSEQVSITIDTSLPENPLLQALLLRLQAEMPDVVLDTATVGAVNITYLFPLLLGVDAIPVGDATLGSDPSSVTVRGTTTLFGEVRPIEAVFTAVGPQLQLKLGFAFGPTTVRQLKDMGLVPPDLFESAAWADDLAQFQALDALFDSASQSLRLTGPEAEAPWSVFGIPSVTLSTPTPDILVRAPNPRLPKLYAPRVKTTFVSDALASPLPIYLQVPAGASPWEAGLDAGDGLYLGNLTDLYVLFGGDALDLPDGLVALGQVTLNTLSVAYDPLESGVWTWAIAFTLGATPDGSAPAPTWEVIPSVLEIRGMSVALTVRVAPDGDSYQALPFGDIRGYFTLGSLPVVLQINVPDIGDWWVLKGATDGAIELSDMAQLLGGNTTALSDTLAPMGTVDGFTLTKLVLVFRPVNPTIKLAQFGMALQNWTVDSLPWFVVDQLALGFKIDNPLDDATRRIRAEIRGQMTLSETVRFGILAKVDSGSSLWSLRMGAWPALLSGVDDLSAILSPAEIDAGVPPGMPLDGPVELDVFGFVYNSADLYFPSIDVTMRNSLYWTIVPDLFVLNSIEIALKVTQASADAEVVVTGRVAGRLNLVGAFLELAAAKPTGEDDWTFTGRLLQAYTIDFQALLQSLISPDIVLPSGYGFPTSLTLLTAQAELVPATGAFSFVGFAYTAWSIDFGSTSFSVTMLGGELHVPATDSGDPSWGKVVGWFTGLGLAARASVQTGQEGIDTVVQVEISDAVLDAAEAVNSISGLDSWDAAPRPPDFPPPQTFRAGVNLNLTQSRFVAYGEYFPEGLSPEGMYGGVALYVAPDAGAAEEGQEPPWGWALGGALHNWTWGQISAGLSPLDQVVLVRDASVVLSRYAEDLPAGTLPIRLPGLDEAAIPPGLSFYAALGFPSEGLFAGVWELLGFDEDSTFAFGGLIPPDSALSSFWAELGNFSLLGLVPIDFVRLNYRGVRDPETQAASWVLTLHGQITVTVDDTPYLFVGDVLIDDEQATAQIVGPAIPEPLGIPTLTLGPSLFDFRHSYTDDTTSLGLAGQMEFAGATVAAFLFFQLDETAVPVVIDVRIANLNLDDLMQQFIGVWPDTLLDVTFLTGELYLATQDWTLPPTELPMGMLKPPASFQQGFFARTVVDVYMMTGLELGFSLTQDGDAVTLIRGYARSVDVIDWGFVSFYTVEGDVRGGPEVFVQGGSNVPYVFGARCTIDLFESPVLGVEVLVGSDFMSGTLTVPEDVALFGGRTLTFRWDDDGFTVNGWQLPDFSLPDMDGFSDVDIEGDCPTEALIQFLPTTDTEWDLDLSFKIYPGTDGGSPTLGIRIKGTFNLVINSNLYDSDDAILTVDIIDCETRFPIPFTDGFSWDDLADAMVQLLKDAASSIFSNLVQDPQNLAKLLAVSGISWAMDQLTSFLSCEGTHEAEEEGMSEEEAEAFGEEFAEAFAEGTLAVGGATVAVVGGAVVLGEAGMDVAGATLAILVGGAAFGVAAGVVTIAVLSSDSERPDTPHAPSLSYDGNQLTASWDAVDNATQYQAQVTGDAKRSSSMSSSRHATFKLDPGTYKVGVVASGPGGTSPPGPKSSATMLGAPSHLSASFDQPDLRASWSAVGGASSYPVTIQVNGDRITPDTLTWTGATSFTATDSRFVAGARVTVEVSATNGWGTGPSADTTVDIAAAAAPTGLTLLDVPGAIQADWQPVSGAQGYVLQVLDATNVPLSPQPTTTISGTRGTIAGSTLTPGASYAVQVAARVQNATSTWSDPVAIVWIQLGIPTVEPPLYDNAAGSLRVVYTTPEGASTVRVELLDATGAALNPQPPTLQAARGSVLLDVSGLQVQGLYGLHARAEATQAVGAWSATLAFTLVPLAAPTQVTVTNGSSDVRVAWAPVAGAQSYRVVVLSAAGTPLQPQPAPELVTGTTVTLPGAALQDGVRYGVEVLAYAAGVYGPAGPVSSFTRWSLPAPSAPTLAYYPQNNGLQASWSPVAGAQTYAILVLDAAGQPLAPQPDWRVSGLTAYIDVSAQPLGTVVQVQVQAQSGAALSPPSAPTAGTLASVSAPSNVTIGLSGADLVVAWTADPTADGHLVEVLDSRGQPLAPQPPMTVTDRSATINGDNLQINAAYSAQVRATLGISLSSWTHSTQVRWVELAAPTQLTAVNEPKLVNLTWLTVSGATDYASQVSDTNDVPLSPQPHMKMKEKGRGWVDSGNFALGTVYRYRVKALAQGVASAWSNPVDVAWATLAAPTNVTTSWRSSNAVLMVSWSAVPGAQTYTLEIFDSAGSMVLQQSGYTTNSAMVSTSTLTAGANYSLKVRGETPTTLGEWSARAGFALSTGPAQPQVTTFTVSPLVQLNDTGVTVVTGDTVQIRYLSGTWTANPSTGKVNASGNARYVAKPGYLLPGSNEGCLVGQVGTNAPFYVGPSGTVPAGQTGQLRLGINDDTRKEYGQGYADNQGSITVQITRTPGGKG